MKNLSLVILIGTFFLTSACTRVHRAMNPRLASPVLPLKADEDLKRTDGKSPTHVAAVKDAVPVKRVAAAPAKVVKAPSKPAKRTVAGRTQKHKILTSARHKTRKPASTKKANKPPERTHTTASEPSTIKGE